MFCIHCGKQIDDGSAFCAICGKSQRETPSNPSSGGMADIQDTGYQGLLAANDLTQNVKCFEGLYTEIAVSSDGYIAIYHPYEPEEVVRKGFMGKEAIPAKPEWLEVLHISQINDFDIDVDGTEETKVSGGLGGALVGGLIGGTMGSILGSAATSGKVKTNTTINGVNLVIITKDFNNPRVEVQLYSRFDPPNYAGGNMRTPKTNLPYKLRQYYKSNGLGYYVFDTEGKRLANEVYNRGEIPYTQIEALQSTLTQMLAAQQQNELAAVAVPQLSAADELTKFKGLLDSGVISQDEFDAKKKQLLSL